MASTTARLSALLSPLAMGVGAAALANILLWFVGAFALGVDFTVTIPNGPTNVIHAGPIALMTVIPALLGVGVYVILSRFLQRPLPVFTLLVSGVTLLSFVPLFKAEMSTGAAVLLGLMHPIAAAGVVVPLWRARA